MKLAFCLFKYFPYGGLQLDFMRILRLCQHRGHEIDVYTMVWEGVIPDGVRCYRVRVSGKTHAKCSDQFSQTVSQIVSQKGYDVVVGFNCMAGLDVYFAADVCFAWRMENRKNKMVRYLSRYRTYLALEKAVFATQHIPHILFLTQLQQDTHAKYYKLPGNKVHLLPPGLSEVPAYQPDELAAMRKRHRQNLGLDNAHTLCLAVGSHFKTKGLKRSLYAYAALSREQRLSTHFVIIGQGEIKPYLRLAKKLGILSNMTFLGAQADISPFMLAADLLLHPSYYESAGLVLLEALSVGLSVITTASSGHAEHVKKANAGVVLPMPFSQEDYNLVLKTALERDCLSQWRQNALNYVATVPLYGLHERAVQIIESVSPTQ